MNTYNALTNNQLSQNRFRHSQLPQKPLLYIRKEYFLQIHTSENTNFMVSCLNNDFPVELEYYFLLLVIEQKNFFIIFFRFKTLTRGLTIVEKSKQFLQMVLSIRRVFSRV